MIADNKRNLPQGGINLKDPDELLFEYTRLSFTSLAFLDKEPKDVVFVGLGAGVMPRYFNRYYGDANIDVVEIDPDIFLLAKKYFHFVEKEKMKVHIADGRVFIKRSPEKYDMIFLDAYKGDSIPFHLTTIEFLREVKKRLKKGGVVVSNILSGSTNKYFWSMVRTYRKEFGQLYIYRGEKVDNFVFVAKDNDGVEIEESDILIRAGEIRSSKEMDINLKHPSLDYMDYPEMEGAAELLTDDFAPVNIFRHQKVLE
jgi:spermidine synthase